MYRFLNSNKESLKSGQDPKKKNFMCPGGPPISPGLVTLNIPSQEGAHVSPFKAMGRYVNGVTGHSNVIPLKGDSFFKGLT